mmetsp:Transcript_52582/g.72080  ORF Transcript_52582/g.72080 Transcript_52582/m.72080 type:complete len:126 (-) Transcript_52582:613-990(-)
MCLLIAIDFTASNAPVNHPSSLHYTGAQNQYESAIKSVGSILEPYDHYQSFPVFGFGGIPHYMKEKDVSHCFPLNGSYEAAEIHGIKSVMKTYRDVLPRIGLAGPTFFTSIFDIFLDYAVEGRNT